MEAPVPYPLDEDLLQAVDAVSAAGVFRVWQPPRAAVVLGRSNRAEREVHLAHCTADAVPVLRRLGGGGAVLLAPGCVVLSLAQRVQRPTAVRRHVQRMLGWVQQCLEALGAPATSAQGSGDLCVGERKILGSSVFRRRDLLFYQASLLVDLDLAAVDRYLQHPSREPAYRAGRPHHQFLTTLRQAGFTPSTPELCRGLSRVLQRQQLHPCSRA